MDMLRQIQVGKERQKSKWVKKNFMNIEPQVTNQIPKPRVSINV